jgi:putative ABC transport system ATP-binding protein
MTEKPVVEVRNISKHFGEGSTRVDALRDVTIDVYPGTVVGLRGPSGSGKSTLLNVIGCITEPNAGKLSLDGELVYENKWLRGDLRKLRLEKIGFIFQSHNLLPFLNAWENVAVARVLAGATAAQAKFRALELLNYLGVDKRSDASPGQLSGGEAQRIAIARALANNPRIILADEPTAALDSQRARTVIDLLKKVALEQKAAVIVVTHDEKIFDRFDIVPALLKGRLPETSGWRSGMRRPCGRANVGRALGEPRDSALGPLRALREELADTASHQARGTQARPGVSGKGPEARP